jgi:hypothetical protein
MFCMCDCLSFVDLLGSYGSLEAGPECKSIPDKLLREF